MLRFWPYTVLAILMLPFLATQNVYAVNIYRVGEEIIGQDYDDVWKRWFDKKFSVWVGVEDNYEGILFKAETGLGIVTVTDKNSKIMREKLRKAVVKAIEWSDVARKNRADASNSLGCFGYGIIGFSEESGTAFDENQMCLKFFAANGGTQTNLIISLVDRRNKFIKTTIYLNLQKMKEMLNVVDQIESTFEKARKTAKDQMLFK